MFEKEIIRIIKKETKLKNINLEVPPHQDLGDFAFPCFTLSKQYQKSPNEIALELSIKLKPTELIESIVPKGPYLNFFINKTKLSEITIKSIFNEKDKYGSYMLGKNKIALIEHTSINPNAAPHVGRARGAIIGDSIVRLLRFQGYKTRVHYFVNDVGKQIAILVLGLNNKEPDFSKVLKIYSETYKRVKKNKKMENEAFGLLKKFEEGDKETIKRFKKVVDICIKGQVEILSQLGIKYDFFDYESKYLFNKKTKDILAKLEKTKYLITDNEGRKVIDLSSFNLPMKEPYFVLTRSNGTSLYGLRDIIYTIDKIKYAKHKNIILLGEDQKLYFQEIKAVLSLLKQPSPQVIHFAHILLANEGKMSTREGNLILLEDFIKESLKKAELEIKTRKSKNTQNLAYSIGVGAVKYSILKVSPDKNIVFDWNSSLSFEGETAPYIQYVHARACSILKKSKIKPTNPNYLLISLPEEINLINKLYAFPEIVYKSTIDLKPHLIANYLHQLAQTFNEFYHKCQCITDNRELTKTRLAIVLVTKQVIYNGLGLLGIDSPEKM